MKVEVMDGWRITSDPHSYTVEKITQPTKEHPGGNWRPVGHYGTLKRSVEAVQEAAERYLETETVEETVAARDEIAANIARFCRQMKVDHCPCCGKEF